MNVTVAVPAHNESTSIGPLLESICGATYERHQLREVLVFDDASTDRTPVVVEAVSARFPVVRLIRGETRAGCAPAVERLLREATGEAIVRINADVVLETEAIERLVDSIAQGAHIAIGAQQPRVRHRSVAALAALFSHDVIESLKTGPHKHHYAIGHLCAYDRLAVQGVVFPPDLINDDHYIANLVSRAGGSITFVPGARCVINLPSTALDYWRVSRRILEGERQLRRRIGMPSPPLAAVLGAVGRTALRKPLHAMCWAPMYLWSSSRPSPTKNSAWPRSPSTKAANE